MFGDNTFSIPVATSLRIMIGTWTRVGTPE